MKRGKTAARISAVSPPALLPSCQNSFSNARKKKFFGIGCTDGMFLLISSSSLLLT